MRPAFIQGVFIGMAGGNIMAAPIIGGGSIIWLLFMGAMLLSSAFAAYGNRFAHAAVVTLVALPLLYLWQVFHELALPRDFLLFEAFFVAACAQVGALFAMAFARLRRRGMQ